MALWEQKLVIKKQEKIVSKDMIKNRKITTCILPDSVKTIEDGAFKDCKNLKKLIFVDELGNYVNNSIEVIGSYAFYGTAIEEFFYSHCLSVVGDCAFAHTPLSTFESYAEDSCRLENIGYDAFLETKIKDIVIAPNTYLTNMHPTWKSILCKDHDGNIVESARKTPYNYLGTVIFSESNLEEISLLGAEPELIEDIICKCKHLKKIHIDLEAMNYLKTLLLPEDRIIDCVLYGETEKLDCWLEEEPHLKVTFDKSAKVKGIDMNFFSLIANTELILPEGVEIIENFSQAKNLKKIILPSTVHEIKSSEKCSLKIVTISKNLPIESYRRLCDSLPDSATIIIKGNHFTKEDKKSFIDVSPSNITLEFLRENPVEEKTLEESSDQTRVDSLSKETLEESSNQTRVNSLSKEVTELINLMSNPLKSKIQDKYNKIIDDYDKNRIQDEKNILQGKLTFGYVDSYSKLLLDLMTLRSEITMNQDAILRLSEIEKYKEQVSNLMNKKNSIVGENDNLDNIEGIIQRIGFTVDKLTSHEEKSIIVDEMQSFLAKSEEFYRAELNNFPDNNPNPFLSYNPMNKLEDNLKQLLMKLEDSIFQEALNIRQAFYKESSNPEINCLEDNIKTINYVVNQTSFNENVAEKWNQSIKERYISLLNPIIDKYIKQGQIESEDLVTLKEQLIKDLASFAGEAYIIYNTDNYRSSKIEEVEGSYRFYCDENWQEQEINTVSSALMAEIKRVDVDFESLHEIIEKKVKETIEKLNEGCNHNDISNIMQQYYKELTDLWWQVCEISHQQKRKVTLKRL